MSPLLQFRNFDVPLPQSWSTFENGCTFSTNYLTRTAVARSNILVNRGAETMYFYQDVEVVARRLKVPSGTRSPSTRFHRCAGSGC